jgi:UDP-N-acetylmuramoylalanine--D-glutamate ligase
MNKLADRNVAVIGLGASGMAAARLALAKGGDVYVSDLRTDASTAACGADLELAGASVELGRHDVERIAGAGSVVVSPGIPPQAPVLRALADRGVRWISEPEFAVRFYSGPLIAVTGTNGKTTTTLLLAHLLDAAGIRAVAGGNVGGGLAPPAAELALLDDAPAWYVLEMSSFQLAGIDSFHPQIGVITNLSPDHLDRYDSVEEYYADKARITANADSDSVWVLPAGDRGVESLLGDAPGRRFFFGEEAGSGVSAFVRDGLLTLASTEREEALINRSELRLLGRHNLRNALAASLGASLAGASAEGIAAGLRSARALPHRMEPVRERHEILWVNDSKATNLAATKSALESLDRPVILLLGGKDKGEDFRALVPVLAGTRAVLAFGAAGPRAANELRNAGIVELIEGDLGSVVERASELARPGDVVLLSPSCSSFDMFDSYEHRGRRFSELVEEVA